MCVIENCVVCRFRVLKITRVCQNIKSANNADVRTQKCNLVYEPEALHSNNNTRRDDGKLKGKSNSFFFF